MFYVSYFSAQDLRALLTNHHETLLCDVKCVYLGLSLLSAQNLGDKQIVCLPCHDATGLCFPEFYYLDMC